MDAVHRTTRADETAGITWALPSRRYLWWLVGLLMSATIFEGYDITVFHLCTPDIARTFHMDDASIGGMASIVRFGGILSFFVVSLADRFGRKTIISYTVLFYAFFTLLTALSTGVFTFTVFQSSSQIFLAAEFGVAITMITEEFPDELRGRGISILHMVAFLGVVAAGTLYGYIAPSRWGWRGMYLLGIAPLLLVALLRRWLRETARFSAVKTAREAGQLKPPGLREYLTNCLTPLSKPYRGRLILIALLWNSIGLVGGPTITFFSLYAKRDHHWSSGQIGFAIVAAYLMATIGTMLCGYLLDWIGRRMTATIFYLAAAAAMATLFQSGTHHAMLFALMATMFAYQGARTATSAFSCELFPTGARATGYCMTVQVLGQLGWTLAPVAVGLLSDLMGGLGNAASLFSAGPIIGAILIVAFAPETAGKTLEELSPEPAPEREISQTGSD
ncbi:MAG: MFS transporter [Candidatus Binataceae bacterium]